MCDAFTLMFTINELAVIETVFKQILWLTGRKYLFIIVLNEVPSSFRIYEFIKNRSGRPCKNLVECSDKTENQLQLKSTKWIATANQLNLCKQGNKDSHSY